MTAFPLAGTPEGEQKGMGQTIDLDLFRSSLNCQFDFRDLTHLEGYAIQVSVRFAHNFQNVKQRRISRMPRQEGKATAKKVLIRLQRVV